MADFMPAYEQGIQIEGGYKLHEVKGDRGGVTYAGIARNFWPNWAGWRDIDAGRTPDSRLVRNFYYKEFWLPIHGDLINDQDVAECIYLAFINARASVKVLQLVLGVTPDGVVGQKTLAAINAADRKLLIALFSLGKIKRYADICNRDRSQEKFLLGWINRVFKELA